MALLSETTWMIISFVLTLLVFSFLLGDNPFFRFVSALLIGSTAGYLLVIIIYQVVLARLVVPLLQAHRAAIVPLLLSGLLLTKLSPRLARLGNLPMALLVGVGAAVAVGGAVLGTLFPQVKGALSFFGSTLAQPGTSSAMNIAEGVFFLVGTIATLLYFTHFSRRKTHHEAQPRLLARITSAIGKTFIAITLGAVFAGVLTAALTALVERTSFIASAIGMLVR